MAKQTAPMSLRLKPETEARLEKAAERLKMKKNKLAQDAIEAAVEAIERNDYKLVIPIEFDVTHTPTKSPKTEAPAPGVESPAAAVGGRSSVPIVTRSRYELNEGEEQPTPRTTDLPLPGVASKKRSGK